MKAKHGIRVRDCMSVDPATVGPKDSLQKVMSLLRRRDIRSVPVVENARLIGIVTDRDVRHVAPAYPLFRDEDEIRRYTEKLTVTAAMTADPITIRARCAASGSGEGYSEPIASLPCRLSKAGGSSVS